MQKKEELRRQERKNSGRGVQMQNNEEKSTEKREVRTQG